MEASAKSYEESSFLPSCVARLLSFVVCLLPPFPFFRLKLLFNLSPCTFVAFYVQRMREKKKVRALEGGLKINQGCATFVVY